MSGAPLLRRIAPADHRIMPWKNGLGTTREIAIDPPGATMADAGFRWRLSIADVPQSGPFSSFPGIDRTIMVIEGNGMVLSVAGRPPQRLDRCFMPYDFSGDAATECELIDGPIRDFNLMVNRRAMFATTSVQELQSAMTLDASSQVCIAHVLAGNSKIGAGGKSVDCGKGDTAIIDVNSAATLLQLSPVGRAVLVLMRLQPR